MVMIDGSIDSAILVHSADAPSRSYMNLPTGPVEYDQTPFTIESLQRRREAEEQVLRERGKYDKEEVDKATMRVLDQRKGYLLSRLKAILDKRDPEEAELIRNQYAVMEQEAEAEAAALSEHVKEKEQVKVDKMLRFLENYSRVQESYNLKIQESISHHNEALERIR